MIKSSRNLMRVVLIALLFEILAPLFLPVVTQAADIQSDHAVLHAHHSSLILPQLLKEKEKEGDEAKLNQGILGTDFPIIDFSDHTQILTQSHESRFMPCSFSERIDLHPPLYTLFGVYII